MFGIFNCFLNLRNWLRNLLLMNIYEKTGKMALGSRLRRLGELFAEQAAQVYPVYGIDIQPKWFPVYYALSNGEEKSITEIAVEIGHSHPSVSTIVKEMMKKGFAVATAAKRDGRKNFVKLSEKGLSVNGAYKPNIPM